MLYEIQILRPIIIEQLGANAWAHIACGSPVISSGYVFFWIHGHECCWGIDTSPVLLMHTETDQEFKCFNDLLKSLWEPDYVAL